jgi:hypothetical protein
MQKTRTTITYAIVAAALALALSSSLITPALAAGPHFVGTPTCSTSFGTDTKTLTCSGKIAGLGNGSTGSAVLLSQVTFPCSHPFFPSAVFPISSGQSVFTASITFTNNCPPVTFGGVEVIVDGAALPIPGTF